MFFAFIKLIGLTLLGELLRPKPQLQHAKPAGLGDFGGLTSEIGRAIQVLFGRARQRGANLLWYGDYLTYPNFTGSSVKGLFKSKTYYTVTGYKYYIGLHMGLCHAGVTGIHKIWAGEKLAWAGSVTPPGTATINEPFLFGGAGPGGGLVGVMSFHPGGAAQASIPYLAARLTQAPAFRGITSAVWERGEVGHSPVVHPFSFEMSRYPATLGYGSIGVDLNPAEALYEVHTDPVWGMGVATDLLDTASFQAAADVLEDEGLGISTIWDSSTGIGAFCEEILRPIDGVLFPSLREAKIKLALARGGYDEGTLPVFSPANVVEMRNMSWSGWEETINQLLVLFTSRASGYKQDVAPAFDGANFHMQGQSVSRTVNYPMVTDATVANTLAWRDLRASSVPLARGTLAINRAAHVLDPGDVFVLRWPMRGIDSLVARATKVRVGGPGEGAIEVDWVQDVFSLASSVFGDAPATEWTEPVSDPEPVTIQDVEEVPYLLLARDDGSAGGGTVDPDLARVLVAAVRPNASSLSASVQTKVGAAAYVARADLVQFTPSATLVDPYPKETDEIDGSGTLVIEALEDGDVLVNSDATGVSQQLDNFARIGDEWIAWETITDNLDGTYTLGNVWRGILDTVPADHASGARIWFLSEGSVTTPDTYSLATTVDVRLIPETAAGELDEGDAIPMAHTITTRSDRPYPPGAVTVNGTTWPETITGDLVVAWAHRDRETQNNVVAQDDGDHGPEAGVTYTLRIYGDGDVLLRTVSGISGTTHTYTEAEEISDGGGSLLQEQLRIELESVRGGLVSHQLHERTVLRGT